MSADALIASYLRIANEDLAGARQLSLTHNRNAMYLCSQAAEKIIRAVLTSEGKNAGIKHQLDELVDMIPDENRWSRTGRPGLGARARTAGAWRSIPTLARSQSAIGSPSRRSSSALVTHSAGT
jgi:HEPN domain-containing protein